MAFEHDGTLYVHAGFSPEMGEMDVAYVNDAATDEIAAFDDYRARMVTDGLARVLLMQREFHMDLRFDDIRPANPIEP